MKPATEKLWTKKNQHDGDRLRLFAAVAQVLAHLQQATGQGLGHDVDQRQRLLDDVVRQGFIENYGGVRISATGKRFRIDGATVWNLLDDQGEVVGQAAAFATWSPLS